MYVYTMTGKTTIVRKFYKVALENITITKNVNDCDFYITTADNNFRINSDNRISFNDIVKTVLAVGSEYGKNEYILLDCFQNEIQSSINRIMQDRRI